MNDYEGMARIIRWLDEHFEEQPRLEQLAELAGLSPSHFQRTFSAWAGVTPKDFVQCLSMERAKQALREEAAVLDASLDAGLSGPGRLHDLCVKLEGVSPGEFKQGGAGQELRYGSAPTPFGACLIAETDRGICHLAFHDAEKASAAVRELRDQWPQASLVHEDKTGLAKRIFQPASSGQALRAWVRGTPFQLKVWRALLDVPAGTLTSYGRLAERIGQPTAARATGSAVGANPLGYLVPCHRVIRETGVIGNYRWGHGRKRALIAWEQALA